MGSRKAFLDSGWNRLTTHLKVLRRICNQERFGPKSALPPGGPTPRSETGTAPGTMLEPFAPTPKDEHENLSDASTAKDESSKEDIRLIDFHSDSDAAITSRLFERVCTPIFFFHPRWDDFQKPSNRVPSPCGSGILPSPTRTLSNSRDLSTTSAPFEALPPRATLR